ncbi:MAG TPA: hypothetical protein VGD64_05040 [Acidisarcina sp.]
MALSSHASAQAPTTINIGSGVSLASAKKLGINLGGEDYWDSRQLTRNIIFQNPGFEGETWQSMIHCAAVTATTCTDATTSSAWPVNFLQGATAEFITGAATGLIVPVTSSTVSSGSNGVGLVFATSPAGMAVGDYIVVRKTIPGNGQAGWSGGVSGGASVATEFNDISPNSPGLQALQINASGANQQASVVSYADSLGLGHSFVQLHGPYTVSFRAKGIGGANQVTVSFARVVTNQPTIKYFQQTVTLTNTWQDYSYTFQGTDTGAVGTLSLTFNVNKSSILLDDVDLSAQPTPGNPTAFRNEVVSTLQALNPGIIRYMDSGTDFGSSLDNMLAPQFARVRAGWSSGNTVANDVPIGLHDFLVLCQTVGAEPWYTFQTGTSTQEMANLMDYLGGDPVTTVYGAKRAALGQTAPWTSVFKTIHLEYGNEVWDTIFRGALMTDPTSYGKRAGTLFGIAKASPSYSASSFDLVLDGWAISTYWNKSVLAASSNYDSIDVAPYLFNTFNDAATVERVFGPMFAQPESLDSIPTATLQLQRAVAAAANPPAKMNVYESNLSTLAGSASQTAINQTVPSVGAGLIATEHMLLMMRDLGINDQTLFQLGGLSAGFSPWASGAGTNTPLWGTVIDMGGNTNRVRPSYMALQLANSAILPSMLATSQSGTNPTWNQPKSTNDNISLAAAHYIQSFAYTDGTTNNVILFNLHRTQALPVNFAGWNAPTGHLTVTTLTSRNITDNNETSAVVAPVTSSQTLLAGATMMLPPYSMTVINAAGPGISTISGVTVSCGATALLASGSTPCIATTSGVGNFDSSVVWSATPGTITSNGVYTAPSLPPPVATTATITATSVQDATQSGSSTINLSPGSGVITGVTVTCSASSLVAGTTTNCSANVVGTGSFSQSVLWSASAGTVDALGHLTGPPSGTSVTVQAVSQQDPTQVGTLTLPLLIPPHLGVPVAVTTSTTATISWTTDVPTVSNGLDWGPTKSYGHTTPYTPGVTMTPTFTLTGLLPATTYYAGALSSAQSNHVQAIVLFTFTTQ